jgi:DNA-binding transcriptional ArsR family regulator
MTKRRADAGPSLDALVELGKGLAHPARLRMLAMLAGGELCVCQMTAVLELAASTVSQHLAVLERGGLVTDRKEGKLVFYRLLGGPAGQAILAPLLARLASDPEVRADRSVVTRLRRVPIARLCAAELDLVAIGVRRPAQLAPVPSRRH